jgi:hypothetical protein
MKKTNFIFTITLLLFATVLGAQTIPNKSWIRNYSSVDSLFNAPTEIDANGNVYITGYSLTQNNCYDFTTIKYDNNGVQQWVATYNSNMNGCDRAVALAVDAGGNVYVTGSGQGSVTGLDYVTVKYSANGVQQWVQVYNGTGNGTDIPSAIALDGSGNIYVTGTSKGLVNSDYTTVKYNNSGVQLWVSRYNGLANAQDNAIGLVVTSNNRVFVTGNSVGTSGGINIVTIRYNAANGNQLWASIYNGSFGGTDLPKSIVSDASGTNIVITGSTQANVSSSDYVTIKYNANGFQQWVQTYNGYGFDDIGQTVLLDNGGNIVVTGTSNLTATGIEYTTIKYDNAGALVWIRKHAVGGIVSGVRIRNKMAIDFSNHILEFLPLSGQII